ncbi:MAG: hypothetical protein KGL75_01640 [Acidobacteriota bacterium]|nr:hypothetical protein [Acidobacteriota bacterium]
MPGKMIQPSTWQIVEDYTGKAWSVLGPLVGVALGGYIASRSQRRHWILDSKRLEFKELFATLTRSYTVIANLYGSGFLSLEDERRGEEIRLEALNTIRDRVVIGLEVRRIKLVEKWEHAVSQFEKDQDYRTFAVAFSKIMDELRRSAEDLIK